MVCCGVFEVFFKKKQVCLVIKKTRYAVEA